jgi:hypothetical protein
VSIQNKINLRQLSWWEVIEHGDWCNFAGEDVFYAVQSSIGMTVQDAFDHYREASETPMFYRTVKAEEAK